MPFRVALRQSNLRNGHAHLMNVSRPASPHYGKLWTDEEVMRNFAPSTASIDAIYTWLEASGVSNIEERRGWLHFEMTSSTAEDLLRSEFFEHHDSEGAIRVACDE